MSQRSARVLVTKFLRDNFVLAIVSAVAAGLALGAAAAIHPAESVNLSAQHISRLEVTTAATGTITADATHLQLKGATGTVQMVLPAPLSACPQVAGAFHATCSGGGFMVTNPFTADWGTVVQEFVLPDVSAEKVVLTTRAPQLGGGIQVTVTGSQVPRVCLRRDARAGSLILRSVADVATIPAALTTAPLCEGVVITVSSNAAGPSGFTFQGMTSARVALDGHQLTVAAESSTLTLRSTSEDKPLRGQVEMESDGPFDITATWVSPDFATEQGVQAYAITVKEAGAERLDNVLTRYSWSGEIGPLGAAAGTFLVGLAIKWLLGKRRKRPAPRIHTSRRTHPSRR